MATRDLVVVKVVRAGDLDRAGAEVRVGILIGNDRDQTAVLARSDRDFAEQTDDRCIARVVRMHGDRAVAKHRFRACGRDGDVVARLAQGFQAVRVALDVFIRRAVGQRVFEVPHVAGHFAVLDLEVADRGLQCGVPVDQPLAAVDQALLVHPHKGFGDGVDRHRVHREHAARPVT